MSHHFASCSLSRIPPVHSSKQGIAMLILLNGSYRFLKDTMGSPVTASCSRVPRLIQIRTLVLLVNKSILDISVSIRFSGQLPATFTIPNTWKAPILGHPSSTNKLLRQLTVSSSRSLSAIISVSLVFVATITFITISRLIDHIKSALSVTPPTTSFKSILIPNTINYIESTNP